MSDAVTRALGFSTDDAETEESFDWTVRALCGNSLKRSLCICPKKPILLDESHSKTVMSILVSPSSGVKLLALELKSAIGRDTSDAVGVLKVKRTVPIQP